MIDAFFNRPETALYVFTLALGIKIGASLVSRLRRKSRKKR
jgi:hypothetical protein